ncbi:MAG: hypothetical protein HY290_22705 [Planctomycetia bacterium]|nr:hypothetical protein [Planctomycetia bacterium]
MPTESHATDLHAAQTARRPQWIRRLGIGMLAVAALMFVLVVACRPWLESYGWGRILLNETVGKVGLGSDPDFVIVSTAINERKSDQPWRLVRWWPAKVSALLHEESIRSVEQQIEASRPSADLMTLPELSRAREILEGNRKNWEVDLRLLKERGPSRFCRIEYYVLGDDGRHLSHDEIYVINRGTAWVLSQQNYDKAVGEFSD